MKSIWAAMALLSSALTAGPVAAQSQPPLTYSWVETASDVEIGKRVLGPLASLYPEVGPPVTGHWSRGTLEILAFASRPQAAGTPGLCRAEVAWVWFEPAPDAAWTPPADDGRETLPVVVSRVRTETRFRALPDNRPRPWTDAYAEELEADCQRLNEGWTFVRANDVAAASHAARLQHLLVEMADVEPDRFSQLLESCDGEGCEAPMDLVIPLLRDARLRHADESPCDPYGLSVAGGPGDPPSCLTADYAVAGSRDNIDESITLSARLQTRSDRATGESLAPEILAIRLHRQSLIVD